MSGQQEFVFGVDLDGVVGDFYGFMRTLASEWRGVDVSTLPEDVTYGLPEWGFPTDDQGDEYKRMHRFAVTQRNLFADLEPIEGAPQGLRTLSRAGVRIRIVTHRLFIEHFHQPAVAQTVEWLDHHAIPYRDLCFMRTKGDVGADVYVDDAPENIEALIADERDVIVYTNSTNRHINVDADHRADSWPELVDLVLARKDAAELTPRKHRLFRRRPR
jgi:5'(3')-deoxyribonucleotidase